MVVIFEIFPHEYKMMARNGKMITKITNRSVFNTMIKVVELVFSKNNFPENLIVLLQRIRS